MIIEEVRYSIFANESSCLITGFTILPFFNMFFITFIVILSFLMDISSHAELQNKFRPGKESILSAEDKVEDRTKDNQLYDVSDEKLMEETVSDPVVTIQPDEKSWEDDDWLELEEDRKVTGIMSESSEDEDSISAFHMIISQIFLLKSKIEKRREDLQSISEELVKLVLGSGAAFSNDLFSLLLKLNEEGGMNQVFQDTIADVILEAEKNVVSIRFLIAMYKEVIINDESGLGEFESIHKHYNSIRALYSKEKDRISRTNQLKQLFQDLREDVIEVIKEENNIRKQFKVFLEEQKRLLSVFRELRIAHMYHGMKYEEEERELDELTQGLKPNPTNDELWKQIEEVQRTRQAISAYTQFLKKEGGLYNQTILETRRDEL